MRTFLQLALVLWMAAAPTVAPGTAAPHGGTAAVDAVAESEGAVRAVGTPRPAAPRDLAVPAADHVRSGVQPGWGVTVPAARIDAPTSACAPGRVLRI